MATNRFAQQQRQARRARQTGERQAGGSFRTAGSNVTPTRALTGGPTPQQRLREISAKSRRFGAISGGQARSEGLRPIEEGNRNEVIARNQELARQARESGQRQQGGTFDSSQGFRQNKGEVPGTFTEVRPQDLPSSKTFDSKTAEGSMIESQVGAPAKQATLINETTGERIAVDVGSQEAQDLFGKGFVLEGAPTEAPSAPVDQQMATLVNPETGERVAVPVGSQEAQRLFGQGFVLEGAPDSGLGDGMSDAAERPDLITTEEPEMVEREPINIDLPETIGTDLIQQAFQQPSTANDIQDIIDANLAIQQQILNTMSPGEKEQMLQQEIADVAQQAQNVLLSAEMGIQDIKDQPIAMPFIVGQARSVEERANLKLQALQAQEANLLNRLGIEQGNRVIEQNALTKQVEFNTQNLNTLFAIQDRVRADEDRLFNRTQALKQDARTVLSSILSGFEGMYFDKLSPDQQVQLATLAQQAGIPIDLLQASMDNVANNMANKNIIDAINLERERSRDDFKLETDLRKEFQSLTEVKDFKEIDARYRQMVDVFNEFIAGDQTQESQAPAKEALQLLFQKMLDPGSIVREGEFARSAAGQAVIDRARGFLAQLQQGGFGLTNEVLRKMVDTAGVLRGSAQDTFNLKSNEFATLADSMGLNVNNVVGNFANVSAFPDQVTDPTTNTFVQLPPLTANYSTLENLLNAHPEYSSLVSYYNSVSPGISDNEILEVIQEASVFSTDLSRSVNGSGTLTNGTTTLSNLGSGTITGIDGSSKWKWGLDFVLDGGKGALVTSPVTGKIIDIVDNYSNPSATPLAQADGKEQNGGFGNQVKILLQNGLELWISHLDDVAKYAIGQTIFKGLPIGTQGNTGLTLGPTGVHLDLTLRKPDGSYHTAREVAALLGDMRLG